MKMKDAFAGMLMLALVTSVASAQQPGPPPSPTAEATTKLGGKAVSINDSATTEKGRRIFEGAGALQPDGSVWRAGANNATALHTDGDITIGNINVPAGDYTLYVQLDPKAWKLIVSKQTGQWGINRDGSTTLDTSKEVGRTPMKMSKPPALVETYKMTLDSKDGKKGTLTLAWENVVASVDIAAK